MFDCKQNKQKSIEADTIRVRNICEYMLKGVLFRVSVSKKK